MAIKVIDHWVIRDLKGKRVAIRSVGSVEHAFLSSMLTHVGLDPRKDVTWVLQPPGDSVRLLTERKVDAFMGFPPHAQELRATKVGRVIVNSALDRPWSQYFCCMVTGSREFVRKNPIATKRVLRALIKSAEMCAVEPDRVTRSLVDQGFTRFYSLRLHEAGMIKSSPQRVIAQGTDWRFLNELEREVKG
jgi:NitT/TauT family transport system substrate-binding protein